MARRKTSQSDASPRLPLIATHDAAQMRSRGEGNAEAAGDSAFLLYQSEDGITRIEVRLAGQTVWLPQATMAELYGTTPQNITQHIAAIYDEGELDEAATCKPYLQVRS